MAEFETNGNCDWRIKKWLENAEVFLKKILSRTREDSFKTVLETVLECFFLDIVCGELFLETAFKELWTF